jgi:hypothetical protein
MLPLCPQLTRESSPPHRFQVPRRVFGHPVQELGEDFCRKGRLMAQHRSKVDQRFPAFCRLPLGQNQLQANPSATFQAYAAIPLYLEPNLHQPSNDYIREYANLTHVDMDVIMDKLLSR